jgi:hypothetical protein
MPQGAAEGAAHCSGTGGKIKACRGLRHGARLKSRLVPFAYHDQVSLTILAQYECVFSDLDET